MDKYSENVTEAFDAYLEGTISEYELEEIIYEGKALDAVKYGGRRMMVSLTNNFNNIKEEWNRLLKNAKSDKASDKIKVGGQVLGIALTPIFMAGKGLCGGVLDIVYTGVLGSFVIPLSKLNFPFNPTPVIKKLVIDPSIMEVTRFYENSVKTIQMEIKSIQKKYANVLEDIESGKIKQEDGAAAIKSVQAELEAAAKKLDDIGKKIEGDVVKKASEKYKNLSPEEKAKAEDKEPTEKKGLGKKYDDMRAKDKEKAMKLVKSTKEQIQDGLAKHKK